MKIAFLTNLLKGFDLFSTNVSLRYEDGSSFETATGGICSIILVVVFIIVFMGTLTNTLNRVYIDSTTTNIQEGNPSHSQLNTSSFMFALGISDVDLNSGDRWFDVYMQFRFYSSAGRNRTNIKLQKCQKQQWTSINQTYGDFYDNRNLQQWLCPPSNLSMSLQGKYTSQFFDFYKVAVKQCNPSLDPTRPCVEDSIIEDYINQNEAFNFNFYFVNTIINPGNKEYVSTFIDDFNYFPFSKTTGTNANFYISSYTVSTDNSILPYEQIQLKTGGIVLDKAQLLNYEVRQNQYMKLNIRKGSLVLDVTRTHRKIDDTISYIGGLFSAIISALLILGIYSEMSFQLNIAKSIYKNQRDDKQQAENFNILTFFGFMIYSTLTKIKIDLPWTKMRKYDKSLEEIRKQMDIRLILHKIQFTERVANALLDKHQVKILHLQEYMTLDQSEAVRGDFQFHNKLEKYYYQYLPKKNQQKNDKEKVTSPYIRTSTEHKFQDLGMQFGNNKVVNDTNSLVNSARDSVSSKMQIQTPKGDSVEDESKLDFMKIGKHRLSQNSNQSDGEQFENMQELTKELKICISLLKKQEQQGNIISRRILDSMDKKLLQNVILQHQDQIQQLVLNPDSLHQNLGINIANDILQFIPRIMATPRRTYWQKKLQTRNVKSSSIQPQQNNFKPNALEFNQVADLQFKNSYQLKSIKNIPQEKDDQKSDKNTVKQQNQSKINHQEQSIKNDPIKKGQSDTKEDQTLQNFDATQPKNQLKRSKATSLKSSRKKINSPFGILFQDVSDF